jgi:hypothetical protein
MKEERGWLDTKGNVKLMPFLFFGDLNVMWCHELNHPDVPFVTVIVGASGIPSRTFLGLICACAGAMVKKQDGR